MSSKRKRAKTTTAPRKGRAAQSPRKARSEANKAAYRATLKTVSKELAGAPEPVQYAEVTDAIIDDVFDRIRGGLGLRAACRMNRVNEATVRTRIADDEQLTTRYARARMSQADAWADDMVEEAEEEIDYAADGANVEIAHRKHKADVKKWLMGKYHVRQYGDKVTTVLEGNPDKPVQTVTREMTEVEAAAAYQQSIKNLKW